jgi:apolipoprotein N-acyltransferase
LRRAPALAGALAALGAVQTLGFVHSVALWWLPLLGAGVLAAVVLAATPRRAALAGASYACGWLLAGVWWLYISMHRYGGIAAPLAAAAVALLSAALSLYLALAMAAFARWRHGRPATEIGRAHV